MHPEAKRNLRSAVERKLPDYMVLDGYTERTHLRHLPEMACLMQHAYQHLATVEGSRYPVEVYRISPDEGEIVNAKIACLRTAV